MGHRLSVLNLVARVSSALRRVVQGRLHADAAHARDRAGDVRLAGLVAFGHQAKEGADRLGFREPAGSSTLAR